MTYSGFHRHVTRQLCWSDGSPTHASSARQRQCRRCRRKWSYEGLARQWILAQEFCADRNRREAAEAAGVDVHTAGRHYAAFERNLAGHLRRNLKLGHGWTFAAIHAPRRVAAKRVPGPRQRLRLAAQFCFDGLSFRRRLGLLYAVSFSARVEGLVRRKPVRSQHGAAAVAG